jgi:hypothetical protein
MTNTILTLLSPERLKQHYQSGFWQSETIQSRAVARADVEVVADGQVVAVGRGTFSAS